MFPFGGMLRPVPDGQVQIHLTVPT
jgi:hypothetical protein